MDKNGYSSGFRLAINNLVTTSSFQSISIVVIFSQSSQPEMFVFFIHTTSTCCLLCSHTYRAILIEISSSKYCQLSCVKSSVNLNF